MFSFGLHDPPPPKASTPSLSPMDDEAQKRNTDCVYFLASPLTCKKGNNCEYRHSEEARMNPRDCYYWLYKTCLNPNCSFRHPPLEGKATTAPGAQASNTVEPAPPSSVIGASTAGANKSIKPCFFFSQGFCAKAEKCPFLHSPPPPSTIDTGLQQKTLKASHGNTVLVNNKGATAPKGNSSTPQLHNPVDKKPVGGIQVQLVSQNIDSRAVEALKMTGDSATHQIVGSSLSSTPSRHEKRGSGTNKVQKTQFVESSLNSAHAKVNGSRQSTSIVSSHKKPQSDIVSESIPSSISRADARRKKSSLQLESNDPDQREDGEYSPPQDGRRRMKSHDEFSALVHGPHAGSEHVSSHQYREQHQLQQMPRENDQGTSLEQMRPHKLIASKVRTRASQKSSLDDYSDAGDLRAHLTKRRRNIRDDRIDTESLVKTKNPDMRTHLNMPGKETFRKTSRNIGVKRPHASSGTVPDSGYGFKSSPARTSSRSSPNRNAVADHSRKESKIKDRDPNGSGVPPASDARAQLSSKMKRQHIIKETSEFAGPKSLAQIKAERMAKTDTVSKASERSGSRISQTPKFENFGETKAVVSTGNFSSTTTVSKVEKLKIESADSQKGSSMLPNQDDFEGPKPLSLLLKEKRKVESNDVVKEVNKEQIKELVDLSREVEDGEVQDEQEDFKHQESQNMDNESMTPIQRESISRSPSEVNEESAYQGESDAQDDIDSSDDRLKLDLESGENAYGDDEYALDDDDDEDDFAKKLGGFFS